MKDLCQKWEVKLFFFTDVGCNLKQFDGFFDLTDPDTPKIYNKSTRGQVL